MRKKYKNKKVLSEEFSFESPNLEPPVKESG